MGVEGSWKSSSKKTGRWSSKGKNGLVRDLLGAEGCSIHRNDDTDEADPAVQVEVGFEVGPKSSLRKTGCWQLEIDSCSAIGRQSLGSSYAWMDQALNS